MITSFTGKPSRSGEEPIQLIRLLAFEYLGELASRKDIELMEVNGNANLPLLLVVIPNAKVEDNKIVSIVPTKDKTDEA